MDYNGRCPNDVASTTCVYCSFTLVIGKGTYKESWNVQVMELKQVAMIRHKSRKENQASAMARIKKRETKNGLMTKRLTNKRQRIVRFPSLSRVLTAYTGS